MPARANDTQDRVRSLQRKLYRAAKQNGARRFHALYDKVHRRDVRERAFEEVERRGGAAGVDGQTIDAIREQGVDQFLLQLEAELREGSYDRSRSGGWRSPRRRAASACSASPPFGTASSRRP